MKQTRIEVRQTWAAPGAPPWNGLNRFYGIPTLALGPSTVQRFIHITLTPAQTSDDNKTIHKIHNHIWNLPFRPVLTSLTCLISVTVLNHLRPILKPVLRLNLHMDHCPLYTVYWDHCLWRLDHCPATTPRDTQDNCYLYFAVRSTWRWASIESGQLLILGLKSQLFADNLSFYTVSSCRPDFFGSSRNTDRNLWYGFLGSQAPEAHRGYRQLNLTTLFLGRLPKRLTSIKCTFYFASNWQLPYLNQR